MPFRDSVGLEFSYLKLSWSWVYHLNWNQKRFSICNYLDVCILCYSPLNHFQTYHNHCWNEPISGRDILIWLILLSHRVNLFYFSNPMTLFVPILTLSWPRDELKPWILFQPIPDLSLSAVWLADSSADTIPVVIPKILKTFIFIRIECCFCTSVLWI